MGDAKVEAKIRPVSVASLELPEGVREQIAKIAEREGSQNDLDTAEEFKAAAEALQQIRTKSRVALSKLKLNPTTQISNDRITVWEGGTQYEYSVQASGPNFAVGRTGFLLRRNVKTGGTEEIYQDARGCSRALGSIKQIATVREEIFVIFSDSPHRFGKVVVNEYGRRVIQYANLSEPDWTIQFVEENGWLAVETTNASVADESPSLVSHPILGAKEFFYREHLCD